MSKEVIICIYTCIKVLWATMAKTSAFSFKHTPLIYENFDIKCELLLI